MDCRPGKVDGTRVAISGHKEVLAQTLQDCTEDVDDANWSGPSHRTNFTSSTGNSTNDLEVTIQQHMLCNKAIWNIDFVDKNYILKSNLHKAQEQMAALLAQNQMLQD